MYRRFCSNFYLLSYIHAVFSPHTAKMCPNPVDIIVILDESRSIWGPDFDREKKFAKEVVKLFDPTISRFGVETFSVGAHIKFHLGDFTKQEDVLDAIDKIQQVSLARTIRTHYVKLVVSCLNVLSKCLNVLSKCLNVLSKCLNMLRCRPMSSGGSGRGGVRDLNPPWSFQEFPD